MPGGTGLPKPPLERDQKKPITQEEASWLGHFPGDEGGEGQSLLLFAPSTDWNIHAVECWHPAVVVEAYVAAGRVLADAAAAHPVSGPIRQRLTEGLVVPAAQRHVAAAVPLLALLAGVVTVTGVGHPQRVSGPHAIRVNDEREVAAGALQSGEAACRQQGEDLHQQMMREQSEKRLRLQQLLQPLSYFQERTHLRSAHLR